MKHANTYAVAAWPHVFTQICRYANPTSSQNTVTTHKKTAKPLAEGKKRLGLPVKVHMHVCALVFQVIIST